MAASLEQQVEWQWGEIIRLTVTLQTIDAGSALLRAHPEAVAKMRADLQALTKSLPELEARIGKVS